MNHLSLLLLLHLLLLLGAEAGPLPTYSLQKGEFQYFYNLELVHKLQLLADNKTEITEEDVERIVNHEDQDEKMDEILDKMLDQGNMIEEVLI